MLFSLFHFEVCLVEENAEYVFICFNLISDVISIKNINHYFYLKCHMTMCNVLHDLVPFVQF